jgi:hypothetical protein
LLAEGDPALQRRGERGAEQGAAVAEGELLAGLQDGPGRGVVGGLVKLGDVGDGLLQRDPMRFVAVFDGQRRHLGTSVFVGNLQRRY